MDAIEGLWRRPDGYPRLPRETLTLANLAREACLLDSDEYAVIVPVNPEDDYPFNDWGA